MPRPERLPEAVVFDMDGVLVDSEEQWRRVTPPLLRRLAPGWREADYERVVGLGVEDLHALLAAEYGLRASRVLFLEECDLLAREVYCLRVSLAGGLLPLLDALRGGGVPLGLASSSPLRWIRLVIERFALAPRFQAVVGADDVAGRTKPWPDIYLEAARRLGARPGRSVAVEDSAYGVLAAKRAGLRCVALRNGANDAQDLSLADLEVRGLGELDRARLAALTGGEA